MEERRERQRGRKGGEKRERDGKKRKMKEEKGLRKRKIIMEADEKGR